MAEADAVADYGGKERGYVQPYNESLNQMLEYLDANYSSDEPSMFSRRKMLKDAQVKSVVEFLKEAVMANGYEFHYDWEDSKELGEQMVSFLRVAMDKIDQTDYNAGGADDLVERWMDALWYKHMVCELVWAHDVPNKMVYVRKAKVLPPESLRFPNDKFGNLKGVIQYPHSIEMDDMSIASISDLESKTSVTLQLDKLLIWINGDDYSQFQGKSELDPVYKYWFLKDFILKFWSIFTERFGAPLLVAFVKTKNMKEAREKMKNILTETSFALEQQDKLEVVEPEQNGEIFQQFIAYCDRQITKGLLVPTLLLSAEDKGARNLGEIHEKMLEYRIQYIQRKLHNLMRALIKKLIDLNFPRVEHYPVFTFSPLSVDKRVKMAQTADLLVKNAIIHPNEAWVRKELQLPEMQQEYKEDLQKAWISKMARGGQPGIGFGSPTAEITRTEAQTPNMSLSAEERSDATSRIAKQFDDADERYSRMLFPMAKKLVDDMINVVGAHYDVDPSKLAEEADWVAATVIATNNLELGMTGMVDELLVDILLEDNLVLVNEGMVSSFDVQTRTGAFSWIDQKMADIRSGLITYSTENAASLELQILEDTKRIVQAGIDEGLRGRDVVAKLKTELPAHYSEARLWTIVRTNTTAIVNNGKLAFARANSDFVKGMRFQAVLDDRTTQICEELNDMEFPLNDPRLNHYTPPLHFNCRSILDYITKYTPKPPITEGLLEVPEGFGGDTIAI